MPRCGCASECVCSVVGSNCITVGGSGAPGTPYTVAVKVNPAVDNGLVCTEDGLYASGGGGGGVLAAGQLVVGEATTTLPAALVGVPSRSAYSFGVAVLATNMLVFPDGAGPAYPHAYMQCSPGFDGLYLVSVSVAGWTAGPTVAGDGIFRVGVGFSGTGGAAGMMGVPMYSTTATPFNAPAINQTGIIPLVAGDKIWVEVGFESYSGGFAGATLNLGPTYDTIPTAGLAMTAYRVAS